MPHPLSPHPARGKALRKPLEQQVQCPWVRKVGNRCLRGKPGLQAGRAQHGAGGSGLGSERRSRLTPGPGGRGGGRQVGATSLWFVVLS